MEEDLLIRFFRDPQTNEFLIAGPASRTLRPSSAASKSATTPRSPQGSQGPYRETIRAKVEAPGRHKKQTASRPIR